jgi:hypothetical protein
MPEGKLGGLNWLLLRTMADGNVLMPVPKYSTIDRAFRDYKDIRIIGHVVQHIPHGAGIAAFLLLTIFIINLLLSF